MADLEVGQQFIVNTGTTKGLNFRREPTTKATTKDGKTNLILSLQNGTMLTLVSVEVPASDGYHWYHVQPRGMEVTGWVVNNYVLEGTTAPPPRTYTFKFGGKTYRITEPHLAAARPNFIFDVRKPNSQPIIVNGKRYFTTLANIIAMQDASRQWIT